MKKRDLIVLILLILAVVAVAFFIYNSFFEEEINSISKKEMSSGKTIPEAKVVISEKQKFIDSAISFAEKIVESSFTEEILEYPEELDVKGNWNVAVALYYQGEIIGEGASKEEVFSKALEKATEKAVIRGKFKGLSLENIKDLTFLISLSDSMGEVFSFVGKNKKGKESLGDLVLVFNIDKELIKEKIKEGKEFLLRMENSEKHGFYKKYQAGEDYLPPRIHTVYSASIIYTFLYMNDLEKDEEILNSLSKWGEFLLFMQNKEKGEALGAFHYSYFLDEEEKEMRFPVGTSALSIFTLLKMYEVTGDSDYLEAAKLAGDWLVTIQEDDGSMKPYLRYEEGKWFSGKKESLLYNGQCLSALSKLYQVTNQEKYYLAASKIAKRFVGKYEEAQGYIVGEYREKNPISNAWAVMSLMDFCKAENNEYYKTIIFELIDLILENQIKDETDLRNFGRWEGAYSTSGIGWLSEVTGEVYRFCLKENREDCQKYKEAVLRGIRWIIQRTYSENNSFMLENPERAQGGIFWNDSYRYVRTDSVCHGGNSYVRILNNLNDGTLIFLPERSLEEILIKF